jgi:UDP-2,3-diacylglucosamine pyrophosphatase LpxH
MADRTAIISDLHLGRPKGPAAEMLRPIWREAARLIVNGDVAEAHHAELSGKAGWQVLELRNYCEHDGVELTLVCGNHDPYLGDCRHLSLAAGRIFITHGDVLHPSIAPWCPTARQVEQEYFATEGLVAAASTMDLDTRLEITRHAAHLSWQEVIRSPDMRKRTTLMNMVRHPICFVKLLHYWRIVPRLAADFAERYAPRARFVLIGHTHRQGIWRIGRRTIINTGAFAFPARPRAVVLEGGRLAVHRVRRRGDAYHLVDRPLATFAVDDGPSPVPR